MRSARNPGRVLGVLLFLQLAGLMAPFMLIARPLVTADFMFEAAASSTPIRAAVLMFFANSLVTIAIAVTAYPVLRRYGHAAALWLWAMSVMWFCMQAVDSAHILSMMTLSERFQAAGGANTDLYAMLAAMLRSTRRYIHYSELLVIDFWMAVLFGSLFRYALVPRVLAAICVAAVVIHTFAISLSGFVGYAPQMWLGVTLAFVYVAMGGWLVAKGFAYRDQAGTLETDLSFAAPA